MQFNYLSLDIETVPQSDISGYPDTIRSYIEEKIEKQLERNPDMNYDFFASIDGDFGKIICISLAVYDSKNNKLKMKSCIGENEKELLLEFNNIISKYDYLFIHYNGINFDIPFILKRMVYHQIELSNKRFASLRRFSSQPHFDLMQEWAFWDYQKIKGLEVMCYLHKIPSPKSVLHGSKIYETYKKGDWVTIQKYCEFDAATVLNLYLKIYHQYPTFQEVDYIFSNNIR
jgi:3'-5' exonuclease